MDGSFGSENRDAGVCHKGSSGVREIHNPSFFTEKELEVELCFEVSYLFAESRLRDVQSVGSFREVHLFGQDNDRVQLPNFDKGKHCSKPRSRVGDTRSFVLPSVREIDEWLFA
jgi:hypothetical protein